MKSQWPRPGSPSPTTPITAPSAAGRTSCAGSSGFGEKSVRKPCPLGMKPSRRAARSAERPPSRLHVGQRAAARDARAHLERVVAAARASSPRAPRASSAARRRSCRRRSRGAATASVSSTPSRRVERREQRQRSQCSPAATRGRAQAVGVELEPVAARSTITCTSTSASACWPNRALADRQVGGDRARAGPSPTRDARSATDASPRASSVELARRGSPPTRRAATSRTRRRLGAVERVAHVDLELDVVAGATSTRYGSIRAPKPSAPKPSSRQQLAVQLGEPLRVRRSSRSR